MCEVQTGYMTYVCARKKEVFVCGGVGGIQEVGICGM